MNHFLSKHLSEPFRKTMITLPWFGPAISATLVALVVNILSQALYTWGGMELAWGAALLLLVVTVAFVYAFQKIDRKRRQIGLGLKSIDMPAPSKHKGLVFLFSREGALREAIQYHQPDIVFCWLIVTPEARSEAEGVREHFPQVHIDLREVSNHYDAQDCYQKVKNIYEHEALSCDLVAEQIICDITGGTKPMTMGMILACLDGGYAIEHVPTRFVDGKPTGPLPPIEIRVDREL